MRRILVTGARGFIGRRLIDRLLADDRFADARISACDVTAAPDEHDRVDAIAGDIADAALRRRLIDEHPELVFHLAGILGGAAEADPALARRVNVDATLSLFDDLRNDDVPPRIVFASSIAVFGPPLAELIDDHTEPRPIMLYGAHKRMMEVALEQASARGWVDGVAIRLPGIVARADADARQRAAFINLVFHAVAHGDDIVLPVPEDGTTWMISVPTCVDAFVHAALLPRDVLGPQRAFTLPAQVVAFGELVAALRAAYPTSRSRVSFDPKPDITAQFASQPPLRTQLADDLGFRHDGSLADLIDRALTPA